MAARRPKQRVKRKSQPRQRQVAPRARSARPAIARMRATMDSAAQAWARLMDDPCNAPLVYPCYGTGGGGTVLFRAEYDSIAFNAATETAGIYVAVPGCAAALINGTILTSDTFNSTLTTSPVMAGQGFLTGQASSFRAVAGCVQVMYPGTELNRSGIVAVGVVPADSFTMSMAPVVGGIGTALSASSVRSMCAHTERMPSTVIEAKWFPGEADQQSIAPAFNAGSTASLFAGRNALVVAASGFPASTGIRIRTVVIYEATLISTSGGLGSVQSAAPPVSGTTPSTVIKALFDKDAQWWLDSAVKAGRVVSSAISYASMGARAASKLAGTLAIMAV